MAISLAAMGSRREWRSGELEDSRQSLIKGMGGRGWTLSPAWQRVRCRTMDHAHKHGRIKSS